MNTIEVQRDPRAGRLRWFLLTALLLSALFGAAQVPIASAPPPSRPPIVSDSAPPTAVAEYLISPDDVLEIYVLDVPELSREYRVSADGNVTIPLIAAPVRAAGLTLTQFSALVSETLKVAGIVSDAHVSTSVHESRLHAVAITGAVKKPQIYPVLGQTTLLDVLSQAEGLDDDAGNFAIVRRGDIAITASGLPAKDMTPGQFEAARTLTVDLQRVLESGDPDANVTIYPGDRITVPRAGIVYVVGAVNRPGGFPMKTSKQGITVLQAIALAEDLKGTAVRKKAVIIRASAQKPDGREQIPVDLNKVLSGKAPDPVLQAEDILFVPDSSSKRALRRAAEAAIQTATGVAIYRR